MTIFCHKIGLRWKVIFKRNARYFLLIYVLYQMHSSLHVASKGLQEQIFSTEKFNTFRKLYNLENFFEKNSDTSLIENKYIQEVCNGIPINSSHSNINYTISLSFEPITKYYVEILPELMCYKRGTIISLNNLANTTKCDCLPHYFGDDCGFPAAVRHSEKFNLIESDAKVRKVPKRVLNGFLFNHEFDMLEARLHDLHDVVDIFVILESQYSSLGEKKSLRFYERFKKGYLKEFSNKILHISLNTTLDFQQLSGADVDKLMRCYLSKQGLASINGIMDDDIFILSDADEIPSSDVVAFLKLYDGLPHVAKLVFKWNIYGFFWQPTDESLKVKTTNVFAVTSIGVLKNKLNWNSYYLRNENAKGEVFMTIGTHEYFSGWHCSWCFSPEGILLKMNAAHNGDQPRLGDDPEKKNLKFIRECVKNGTYFYDAPPFKRCYMGDYMYAPQYLIEHFENYRNLLQLN